MKSAVVALFTCLGSSAAAFAVDLPPMGYFAGRYEIVGRVADDSSTFISGHASLSADGERLFLTSKTIGKGWLAKNPSLREGASPLAGELDGREMFCLFQNDPDNYPRLTCKTQPGSPNGVPGLLTLWPMP